MLICFVDIYAAVSVLLITFNNSTRYLKTHALNALN